ncbi:MAG: LLM class flavin-dependent oxidoreductase [Chloroflexi bacterium]|nr:LLM class flavin-dependent oxidoreductase [Chloroflexota bacterium]
MKYGFVLPGGTAQEQLEQAVIADEAGWDGVFVWEAAYGVDAWTLLAAMSQRTRHVRLGTMLTPLAWRRPWKVASQVVTLDQLSGGRAILSIGLGSVDAELGKTGEVDDRRTRAAMVDEGVDVMRGLWEGRLAYGGQHYAVDLTPRAELAATARPVQSRIPIWVVGAWPRPKSMRRVLRCDGLLPMVMRDGAYAETTPDDIRAMRAWLAERGGMGEGFDVIMEGETPADDVARARDIVAPWAEAGCTWWLDSRWTMPHEAPQRMAEVRERLAAGPPK